MNNRQRPQPRKEALFVRVPAPDDTVAFHNATSYIGKPMPFTKPQATCGMRASSEVVSFSLLHLTKRTASNLNEKELEMPRGPLARVERRALALAGSEAGIGDTELVVEMGDTSARFVLERDANSVLSLENVGDEEDISFELPKSAVQMNLFLRSPGVKRVLAVGFIGHVGKPGNAETVRRVAAMVLFSLSQLTEFKVLGGIEVVTIPTSPARFTVRSARKPSEKPSKKVQVYLFSGGEQPQPVATGSVTVEVDIESANPASNRLLFHITPEAALEEVFGDYRAVMDSSVAQVVRGVLGDEDVAAITYDIVLGDVSSSTIGRLKDALEPLEKGMDFTPSQFQLHNG